MPEDFVEYLKERHFEKNLKKLTKKLKGKSVVIYGTGKLFDCMFDMYDLNKFNIIALSDKKYEKSKEKTYFGYNTIPPSKIAELKPDCVLVATLRTIDIIEYLRYILLKGTNITVLPLVKKSLAEIWKEIW